jgi:carbonic anhydrase
MQRPITRRAALRSMLACTCCLSGFGSSRGAESEAAERAGAARPHWAYHGAGAPERWGELSPDFKACQIGTAQTPIDLDGGLKAQFEQPFSLAYRAVAGQTVNNGHTIQVDLQKGCSCTIDGVAYDLAQFHFHHPSEHLLSGKPFKMELHLVHKAANGALAVTGVFLREGAANRLLAPVFADMPKAALRGKSLPAAFDPSGLLPAGTAFYRYTGSLTTPPCSEGLTWTVFREPIEASREQIREFVALFPHNARPVQNLNARVILHGGS